MKRTTLLAITLACLSCGVSAGDVKKTTTKHEVVLLTLYPHFYNVDQGMPDRCGEGYGYAGMYVLNADSSDGAPKFSLPTNYYVKPCEGMSNNYPPAAESIARLLDAGYEIRSVSSAGDKLMLVQETQVGK